MLMLGSLRLSAKAIAYGEQLGAIAGQDRHQQSTTASNHKQLDAQRSKTIYRLPQQLHGELDQPRRPGRRDAAEVCARSRVAIRLLKLRVIPGVEHLRPELKGGRLPREGERFLNAEIVIIDSRTIEGGWPAVAEVSHSGNCEAGGVKPEKAVVAD